MQSRQCFVCKKKKDVMLPSSKTEHIKICLECYTKMDARNPKDFGNPEVFRYFGRHKR